VSPEDEPKTKKRTAAFESDEDDNDMSHDDHVTDSMNQKLRKEKN
jgi:hypothetical protein